MPLNTDQPTNQNKSTSWSIIYASDRSICLKYFISNNCAKNLFKKNKQLHEKCSYELAANVIP